MGHRSELLDITQGVDVFERSNFQIGDSLPDLEDKRSNMWPPVALLLDLTRTNNHPIMDEGLGHCIKVMSICVTLDAVKYDNLKCDHVNCGIVKCDNV